MMIFRFGQRVHLGRNLTPNEELYIDICPPTWDVAGIRLHVWQTVLRLRGSWEELDPFKQLPEFNVTDVTSCKRGLSTHLKYLLAKTPLHRWWGKFSSLSRNALIASSAALIARISVMRGFT